MNYSSAYHPHTDGQTEVVNRTLGTMLRSLASDTPKQWDLMLPQVEFAFNSMVNRSFEKAHFTIVYTKTPSHTTNLLQLPTSRSKAATSLVERITKTIEDVRAKLLESNAHYKAAADVHRRLKVFNEGDLVMVHLRRQRFPVGEYSKLKAKKYGPFRVHSKINDNAYVIELPPD